MPTGARLISGIYFGFLAFVAAQIVHNIFEAEAGYALDFGYFKEIMAVIGVLCGWIVQGKRVGEGNSFAVQGGILTSVAIVFWGLVLWSIYEMVTESMKLKYGGAMQAIVDAFRIALDHGQTIATLTFITTMLIGGIIGGYLGEWAARRYR